MSFDEILILIRRWEFGALSHRKIVTSSIKDSDKLINQLIRVASKEEFKNTCLPSLSLSLTPFICPGCLYLLEHDEEYTFTLPCAYARSILTVPWVELGGKVNINCAKSGYSAVITFQTKPFYGGKLHK